MQTYQLNSIVLVVQRTTCTHCNRSYLAPSNVMLSLKSVDGAKREYCALPVNALEFDLPRETKIVDITVPACQECFQLSHNDSNQFSLFPKSKELYTLEGQVVGKNTLPTIIKASAAKAAQEHARGTGNIGGRVSGKPLPPKPPKIEEYF